MSFRPKAMIRNNQAHSQAQRIKQQIKPIRQTKPARVYIVVRRGGQGRGR